LENFEMKKTLLLFAVVAASGAAFAQSATLSGSYVFGYQSTKVAGVRTAGIGTDTAAIALTATEDLGGGLKATAKVSLGGMMRDGAGTGEDASVFLSGGFGSLFLGTIEADDGLSRAYAGAPVIGLDGKVHGGNVNIDIISYTTPALAPGLTAGLAYFDWGTSKATGLSGGTTGVAFAQPAFVGSLTYDAGPVSANLDITSWTRKGTADIVGSTLKNRLRISGNYNLGVVKMGLGYSSLKFTTGETSKNTTIGVSAPFGVSTVGAAYEKNVTAGVTTTGTTFGAQYNLSKRTSVSGSYAQWKKTGASTTDNTFRVLVGHSF
jgi:Gram-negative porin